MWNLPSSCPYFVSCIVIMTFVLNTPEIALREQPKFESK